jgi:ABC-type polysaccharide/polyol phosphate export permease
MSVTPAEDRPRLATLLVLVKHEFRLRYRARALGAVWSFLQPIVMMAVLSAVLPRSVAAQASSPERFSASLLVGIVFWNFWSSGVSAAVPSLVERAQLLRSTPLPRPFVPLSVMLSYTVNLGIESLALAAFVPVFPVFRASVALAIVPVVLLLMLVAMAGVVLLGSALNALYRDVGYLVTTTLLLLFWLTPIVYPLEGVSEPYRAVVAANPLTAMLESLRAAMLDGRLPDARAWAAMAAPAVALLVVGYAAFRRLEPAVLDHV